MSALWLAVLKPGEMEWIRGEIEDTYSTVVEFLSNMEISLVANSSSMSLLKNSYSFCTLISTFSPFRAFRARTTISLAKRNHLP